MVVVTHELYYLGSLVLLGLSGGFRDPYRSITPDSKHGGP
jgi:hypothetical protein